MTHKEWFKDKLKDLEITQVYLHEYLILTNRKMSIDTIGNFAKTPSRVRSIFAESIMDAIHEIEARKNTCYDWDEGKLELLEEMKRKGVMRNGHKGNAKNRRGDRQARARKT